MAASQNFEPELTTFIIYNKHLIHAFMKKIHLFLSTLILFAASCNQSENSVYPNDSGQAGEITPKTALTVAKNFDAFISVVSAKGDVKNARTGNKEKTVKKITPFKDSDNKILYYVINYQGGGFTVISAEKKMMPIIAFSETNDFPVDSELPAGIKETMGIYQASIQKLRNENAPEDPKVAREWARFGDASALDELIKSGARTMDDPIDPPCEEAQIYAAPLLTTNWGQGCGYTAQMPPMSGCTIICDNAYTGCIPTAMAQVMNYHRFPNSFDWSAMGTWQPETNRLMRALANSVSTTYTCTGSSAVPTSVRNAFVNTFGYNSGATFANFNSSTIMNEIGNYSRPVILHGYNSAIANGHSWVADGYIQYYNCTSGWGEPYFHMNWGWDGAHNGFYASYTPNGKNFNYNKKMDIYIRP